MTSKKLNFAVCLVSLIAALAGLLFGFDTGIVSGAILVIQKSFPLTAVQKECIVSAVLVGAMIASLISGRLADNYGRKDLMLVIAILFITGTLIAALAGSIKMLIVGRLLIGFAIGMGSYIAPLYIAEAAPYEWRGGLVSLNQLAITIGILCSYLINYAFVGTEYSWRWMFGMGVVPAVLLGVGMLFLPDSPRWLIKQNQLEKAKKILAYLRGTENIHHELSDIQQSLNIHYASFKEVFAPWVRRVLFLGIFLGFLQQVSGINTIIYYAPTIFEAAGFHDISNTILATVGIGVVNVLSTIWALIYLDRKGRRTLMFAGLIGMAASLFCLSFAFRFGLNWEGLRWVSVVSIFVFIICFAFSLGPLLWLMVSEIFPLRVRGTAMSIAVFSCWFWNAVVSGTFLSLLNALGPSNTFLLFGAMCVLGLIVSYFILPETKGVSLEHIEENIRKGLPLKDIGA
jgi:sugar porter (SP) family MFS transporter